MTRIEKILFVESGQGKYSTAGYCDNTCHDFTYNDFTYHDFTYNDFTYNDNTSNDNTYNATYA